MYIRNYAPAFGGMGNINHYIYDKRTNQYLGSYKNLKYAKNFK